jgi:ABC-type transport system substrate-binding protein
MALATGAADAAGQEEQKVLRYSFEIAETGFDPAQISDLYSRNVTANLFDAPLRFAWLGLPGTPEPNTAAALPEVSADFRVFTVTIRPGIYFADDEAFGGQRRELVAADYVYSIKRIADPRWKSPSFGELEEAHIVGLQALREQALKSGKFDYDREIEGLQTLDRYRFRFRLERASPRFANGLADPSIFGAVAREVVERYGDQIMAHPVGTGPFRLAQWRRSSRIVLERNPGYREERFPVAPESASEQQKRLAQQFAGRRLPMIDRVEISPIEESQPRWLAFLNGEHDLLERMPRDLIPLALSGTRSTPVLQRKHIQTYRSPEIDVALIAYNVENPTIGGYTAEKVALRRALNLGLDTDELIRSIYKYQAFPAQTLVQPGVYGYDPQLHTENGDYDPVRANALLDLYGYRRGADGWRTLPDGSALELEVNVEPDQRSRLTSEIFQRSFHALGVRVGFKTGKWPENLRLAQSGQFQIWFLAMSASGPDSEGIFRLGYSGAIGGFDLSRMAMPEFDREYRAFKELPDGPQRLELVRSMATLLVAYAPYKAIVHRYKLALAYPWVQGFYNAPFIRDWWRYIDVDAPMQARGAP